MVHEWAAWPIEQAEVHKWIVSLPPSKGAPTALGLPLSGRVTSMTVMYPSLRLDLVTMY